MALAEVGRPDVSVDAVPIGDALHIFFNPVPDSLTEKVGDKLGFVKRQAKGDLERFKTYIENRGRETGEWRGEVSWPPPANRPRPYGTPGAPSPARSWRCPPPRRRSGRTGSGRGTSP